MMTDRRALAAVLYLALIVHAPLAAARDPAAVVEDANDAVAAELAECAAYYQVSAVVAENASGPKELREFDKHIRGSPTRSRLVGPSKFVAGYAD